MAKFITLHLHWFSRCIPPSNRILLKHVHNSFISIWYMQQHNIALFHPFYLEWPQYNKWHFFNDHASVCLLKSEEEFHLDRIQPTLVWDKPFKPFHNILSKTSNHYKSQTLRFLGWHLEHLGHLGLIWILVDVQRENFTCLMIHIRVFGLEGLRGLGFRGF